MQWLKSADTSVKITTIVVCGVAALGAMAAYVVLTLNGSDTTEFRQWIIAVANLVILPFVGVATVASVSAANSAKKAEEQTNGHLTDREDTIAALTAQNRQQEALIRQLQQRRP